MQRLLANASWTLYISDQQVPPPGTEPFFFPLIRRLYRKLFGPDHSLLVVIEEDHPLIPDYVCAVIGTTVKKFCWDRSGQWLFLTVQTHEKEHLEELKDQFIRISNNHTPRRHRSQLEHIPG